MSWQRFPNANYPEAYDEDNMVKATDVPVNEDGGVAEIQSVWNDASGGTFTFSFDGQGPTGTINYNDDGSGIVTELELLSNIADVSVTGLGTLVSPWLIEFLDPSETDIVLLTADDGNLTGDTIGTTIEEYLKGRKSLEVTTATGGPL